MTVIELWCKFKGYQGCTIHQVMLEFNHLTLKDADRFCGILADNIYNITDYWHASEIMKKRPYSDSAQLTDR